MNREQVKANLKLPGRSPKMWDHFSFSGNLRFTSISYNKTKAPFIRPLFHLIIILILIEYPIRTLLPNQPYWVILIKDFFIGILYINILFNIGSKSRPFSIMIIPMIILVGFVVLSLVELLYNPYHSWIFFLLGIRSYIWYIPFIFIGFYYFTDEKELLDFARKSIILVIIVVSFEIYQCLMWNSNLPLTHPLGHWYHSFGRINIALIPGLFGTGARCARFLYMLLMVLSSLIISNPKFYRNKSPQNIFHYFCLALCLVGIFLTGVRSTFFIASISLVVFVIIQLSISIKKVLMLVVFTIVVLVVASYKYPDLTDFFLRSVSYIPYRLYETSKAALITAKYVGLSGGFGLGTASQGIQYFMSCSLQTQHGYIGYFESGIWKIVFESGILGLILYYAFLIYIWIILFKCVKKHRPTCVGRSFTIAVLIIFTGLIMHFSLTHHQVLGDSTTLILIWFLFGVVLRMAYSCRITKPLVAGVHLYREDVRKYPRKFGQ